ncbi:hypothetical protein EGR_03718 [Echinococcus granulosus]|uniref:Uncharacterized protein n=1 Tax=Echinococcus granulosus TaxID=6210 RepID=W6UK20_ECHGR|nr:hypothetical protein EGR_03718 [Echinococcus granulosus]EUB61428.1 hypothetical protein EGR_03718 [Echinococcus granulosus]
MDMSCSLAKRQKMLIDIDLHDVVQIKVVAEQPQPQKQSELINLLRLCRSGLSYRAVPFAFCQLPDDAKGVNPFQQPKLNGRQAEGMTVSSRTTLSHQKSAGLQHITAFRKTASCLIKRDFSGLSTSSSFHSSTILATSTLSRSSAVLPPSPTPVDCLFSS